MGSHNRCMLHIFICRDTFWCLMPDHCNTPHGATISVHNIPPHNTAYHHTTQHTNTQHSIPPHNTAERGPTRHGRGGAEPFGRRRCGGAPGCLADRPVQSRIISGWPVGCRSSALQASHRGSSAGPARSAFAQCRLAAADQKCDTDEPRRHRMTNYGKQGVVRKGLLA